MKANDFIKEHGLEEAIKIVKSSQYVGIDKSVIDIEEAKRLIKQYELVEGYRCKQHSGLSNAKDHILTLAYIEEYEEMDVLRKAVEDVENCQ